MNLVTDPWIPVLHRNGERRLASLQQVFAKGNDYADLSVRPHERIALMRLLIAVAQAALDGPKDIGEWDSALNRLPDAAGRYLQQWKDSFELFHAEHPFLQITNLTKPRKKEKDDDDEAVTLVSKLDFALATGNNTTLFDHGANSFKSRSFLMSSLPLMLLTFQCFSPGGRIAWLDWNGKPRPIPVGKRENSKNSSMHAPCIPGSMLHAFIRRSSVLETVHANLLTKEDARWHWDNNDWGKAIWELMPASWDDVPAVQNAMQTYLGRLVPMPRFIQLRRDGVGMLLGNGFDYPAYNWNQTPSEPSATVVLSNDGESRVILGAGEKAPWRELAALVVRRKKNDLGGPLTLRNISENESFDIWVGAFLTSKASIEDTVESVLHVPAPMQNELGRGAYDSEVKHAEFVAKRLGWAVETWRESEDGGWTGRVKSAGPGKNALRAMLKASAMRHFWTSVEKLRPLLLAHVDAIGTSAEAVEQTKSAWRKSVWRAAFDAYRLSCAQDTPRQIRAYALGMSRLTGETNQGESNAEQETETTEA